MIERRLRVLVLALGAIAAAGCRLSGTAAMPTYVCAAQDENGQRVTCPAPPDSNPGDGCRCVTRATGAKGPDAYFGRVVAE